MIKNFSQAAERNKFAIWACVKSYLKPTYRMLEIGSGSGQHALYFLEHFPELNILATEVPDKVNILRDNLKDCLSASVAPLDVTVEEFWPSSQFDIIFSSNTLHIMSELAVERCFQYLVEHLSKNGRAIFYGPFNEGGKFTAPSNELFNKYLKQQDLKMGVRCIDWLEEIASLNNLTLKERHKMPANNKILIFCHKGI